MCSLVRVNLELICEVGYKGGGQDIPCCLVCCGHMEVVEEDIGLGLLFGLLVLVCIVGIPRDVGEQHLVGSCVGCKKVLQLEDGMCPECWVVDFEGNVVVFPQACGVRW